MPRINKTAANLPDIPSYQRGESDGAYYPDNSKRQAQAAADTATDIYNIAKAVDGLNSKIAERIVIRNHGIVPVKYCINDTVQAGKWDGIIGAGSAAESGDGGADILFPRRDGINRISVMAVGGILNVGIQSYVPVSNPIPN